MLLGFTLWICYPINCLVNYVKRSSLCHTNNRNYETRRFEPFIKHKVLSSNELVGKDLLIIGDVHGCYDEMKKLISIARGKTLKDLLIIFVGDMLRKGPKSNEVLTYIMTTDNILCVRGNHEQSILRKLYDQNNTIISNEDTWIKDLTTREIEFLSDLPYTIYIPGLNIIVVHAGLVPGIKLHSQNPNVMMNMRNLKYQEDLFYDHVLMPLVRTNEGVPWASLWCGPQHVYFGHDALRRLQCYEHATGLDSGCVYGGSLTSILIHLNLNDSAINVVSKEIVSVNSFS